MDKKKIVKYKKYEKTIPLNLKFDADQATIIQKVLDASVFQLAMINQKYRPGEIDLKKVYW